MSLYKSKQIANVLNYVYHTNGFKYRVKSQSGNGYYDVEETEIGWKCSCPDHKYREMKCKHIWAVEISLGIFYSDFWNLAT